MKRFIFVMVTILLGVSVFPMIAASQSCWWEPENPDPGDTVTIYYDTDLGTLPAVNDQVIMHWGIDELGFGRWQSPPEAMWPPNSRLTGDGIAVQTDMVEGEGHVWSATVSTLDTIFSIHFVFTNGNDWDNHNGTNWNIILQEPEPAPMTWHRFRYDTRSTLANYGVEDITSIYVAGDFNSWNMTANRLLGPNEHGVYWTDLFMVALPTGYKFVLNGGTWVADPDNPLTDGSQYGNSFIDLQPDTLPSFWNITPVEGTIFQPGETFELGGIIRRAGDDAALTGHVEVTLGETITEITFDPESGDFTPVQMTVPQADEPTAFSLELDYVEGEETILSKPVRYGTQPPETGAFFVDPADDDLGSGNYEYPADNADAADLLSISMTEAGGGDSIHFTIEMKEIFHTTRVLFQANSVENAPMISNPLVNLELATPEWEGSGVEIILADPEGELFDDQLYNRIIQNSSPLTTGDPIALDPAELAEDRYAFTLAVADLEAVLGTFNYEWYFSVASYLEGPPVTDGQVWEVDELHGGVDAEFDPDVFDVLFVEPSDLQSILLANYSGNRTAALDATGRGIATIRPGDIGENIGSTGPVLRFLSRGAQTVRENWTVTGLLLYDQPATVIINQYFDGGSRTFVRPATTDTFRVDVTLQDGENRFVAETTVDQETSTSTPLVYELMVNHTPTAVFSNHVTGGTIYLDASSSTDPEGQNIQFSWLPDEDNPEPVTLQGADQSIATFPVPDTPGEYYFDLNLEDEDGNVETARTLATVYPDSVDLFELDESTQWVRDAIVYEIYPRSYDVSHSLNAITSDLQRIAEYGVTAVWLMPIFPGPTAHGYEITDYYNIEEEYGTLEDFRNLVETAHEVGLKVILDLVINHTSIQHPFMRDAIQFGEFSPYWDYYDRNPDGTFRYYYDWYSLPNLNYNNPDVWRYFIDMSLWWVEEMDIDGWRCDVAWGPMQRNDQFWVEWRRVLKTAKPEVFLLAEASSNDWNIFQDRFDLAYDWALHHEGASSFANMFPGPPGFTNLQDLITNYGVGWPAYKYPFRMLENHDEQRYINYHSPEQTKNAATLLFSIPGVPMLYAGQEVGETSQRGLIDWNQDDMGLAEYYYHLVQARNLFPALRYGDFERLNSSNNRVFAFARYTEGEAPLVAILNYDNGTSDAVIDFQPNGWGLEQANTYYLNDLLAGEGTMSTWEDIQSLALQLEPYQAKLYAITDTLVTLDVPENRELPSDFSFSQNYPNPFNATTNLNFTIPMQNHVSVTVFNVLGEKVRTLADGTMTAGSHYLFWDGRNDTGDDLTSGIYFCRFDTEGYSRTIKLVLMK